MLFCFTGSVVPMLEAVMAVVPVEKLAVHFHDTYGQSLSNILVSLQVSSSLGIQLQARIHFLLASFANF